MFERNVNGMDLRFHLAGINNQNFILRDEQTGTYWQQITGMAISGPLIGRRLKLVRADELTYALWKSEEPNGTVLNDVAAYTKEYAPKDWDLHMDKVPTVLSYAQAGLKPRDIMLGVRTAETARAFPYREVVRRGLIQDRLGETPVLLVLGPDGLSVRAFEQLIPGVAATPQFYRLQVKQENPALFLDSATGSSWNFQGCAVAGELTGRCLKPVNVIKDYWFDWRNYHPDTAVFGISKSAGGSLRP